MKTKITLSLFLLATLLLSACGAEATRHTVRRGFNRWSLHIGRDDSRRPIGCEHTYRHNSAHFHDRAYGYARTDRHRNSIILIHTNITRTQMKKIIFALPIVLTLLMSACSSAAPATEISDPAASSTLVADLVNQNLTASAPIATQMPSETGAIELNATYENAVSIEMQLLLGTIKLEGTELAVTTE
jgi:uncharacterized protein YcfL